ncbi:MAG: AAA family ATPase [Prosthecobacter sp.]
MLYKLKSHHIATPGNLVVLSGPPKGGKSAIISGMLASTLVNASDGNPQRDTLGFFADMSEGGAVLCFDTEQSQYDSWQRLERVARRAEAGKRTLPPWFQMYSVVGLGYEERRCIIESSIKQAVQDHKSIHSIFIDGVADLCRDPNDSVESFALVATLVQWATHHNCTVVCVIHENPPSKLSSSGKTRGHLGSELERKAESNLRIEKDRDGCSILYGERCRSAFVAKAEGLRFGWSSESNMHTTDKTDGETAKEERKLGKHRPDVDAVFSTSASSFRYNELETAIQEKLGGSVRTAQRRIKEWLRLGIVTVEDGVHRKK